MQRQRGGEPSAEGFDHCLSAKSRSEAPLLEAREQVACASTYHRRRNRRQRVLNPHLETMSPSTERESIEYMHGSLSMVKVGRSWMCHAPTPQMTVTQGRKKTPQRQPRRPAPIPPTRPAHTAITSAGCSACFSSPFSFSSNTMSQPPMSSLFT